MSFKNLVSGKKLPVIFIGSGLSRRYLDSPDWDNLLIKTLQFIGKNERDFKRLKSRIKNKPENRNLINGEINAKVAAEIENEFNEFFYESDLIEKYPDWLDEGVNPFRKCIATILQGLNVMKEKEEEVSLFKALKNKTIAAITTNYDTLLEQLFNLPKESIFIGQPQLFNPNSLDLGELYKIHGCVTDPNNIVITEHDYKNFKNNAKLFTAKLLTLISENPVIFIGYSIDDPNMQQILSDLVSCLSSEQIKSLINHFYFVEYNEGEENLIEKEYLFEAKSYDGKLSVFPISIISTDNYAEVYKELAKLTPTMNINTVKQVKRIVKDIVLESTEAQSGNEEVLTILLEDINKLSETKQKFAIAIGNVKEITSIAPK
ncbi:hypothetical protein E2L07_05870 [Halalkalibacterium halodurans]|uniref:SIR2 family protein n=1 Tax=Halalkalibacterium halodurans TaxID=86665 RepID=UPI001067D538|nr:SIR2 family protein [Halalkalibacterium halodurans]TES56208.1 hypothetical protein E2L07_05870 [Halalkalibacterium halodurans]